VRRLTLFFEIGTLTMLVYVENEPNHCLPIVLAPGAYFIREIFLVRLPTQHPEGIILFSFNQGQFG
jgi:hypothetical protein